MVNWFRRRGRSADVSRPKPRRDAVVVNRVDLAELTPELIQFLGQAAYLQLVIFETLSRAVSTAPTIMAKEAISRVAAFALAKHHGLVAEIVRHGEDPGETMLPYSASIDRYASTTTGQDWYEMLVASYITAGLLDDFSRQLASGLPAEYATRITLLLTEDDGHDLIIAQLTAAIEAEPLLSSRLAMWGRRLVGDTLLVVRSTLAANAKPDEARLEPVFTELIAAHTRRMDALGLTA